MERNCMSRATAIARRELTYCSSIMMLDWLEVHWAVVIIMVSMERIFMREMMWLWMVHMVWLCVVILMMSIGRCVIFFVMIVVIMTMIISMTKMVREVFVLRKVLINWSEMLVEFRIKAVSILVKMVWQVMLRFVENIFGGVAFMSVITMIIKVMCVVYESSMIVVMIQMVSYVFEVEHLYHLVVQH